MEYSVKAAVWIILSVLAGARCATSRQPDESVENLTLQRSDIPTDVLPVVDSQTLHVQLEVTNDKPKTLDRIVQFPKDFATNSDAQVRAELQDLPISFPVKRVGRGLWNLRFPANVLELLARNEGKSTFSGLLVSDQEPRKAVPLQIVVERKRGARAAKIKSAG